MKRIIHSFCIIVGILLLCLCCFTVNASASVDEAEQNGSSPSWYLDEFGTLTISGTGCTVGTLGIEQSGEVFRIIVEEGVTGIGDRAFSGFCYVKYVTLPSTLETIGEESFLYCTSLESIELPEGLKEIKKKAFSNTGITEIIIPDSVKSLGESAFSWSAVKTVKLPEGITSIPKNCFYMSGLESVNIPSTVKTIEEAAFNHCMGLKSIELPEGLTSIEASAFSFTGLTEIQFPSTLKSIGPSAFTVSGLKTVTIPNTITEIGEGAFSNTDLIEVSLPDNMTEIPTELFSNTALVRVYIPDGVEIINYSAFKMSALSSIRIPVSVKKIDSSAFWWCWSLKDVFYEGTEEEWNQIFIKDGNVDLTDATIHYNCIGAVDDPRNVRPVLFHAGFAEKSKQDMLLNITWTDELFLFDANQYHSELAIPCLVMSGAVELEDGENRAFDILGEFDFDREHLFAGYFNTKYNYLKPAAVFGHKQIDLGGEKKDLFVIIVRGTTEGTSDWMTDLSSQVGGFAVASSDMKSRFVEYVEEEMGVSYEEVLANSENNILLVTGHSLGGAIANHLSVDLMGFAPKNKSFFYTFAACQSFPLTDMEYRSQMTNVFNVINTADAIPYMPPIGFYRIGTNLCFTSNHYTIQDTFKRLTSGRTYSDAYHNTSMGFIWVPHSIETYMSFLINYDGKALLDARPIRIVRVDCPVDVEVYDSDGTLVGRIVNQQIDPSIQTQVGMYTDGDNKTILLPEEGEYTFRLTGTDNGEMTYSVDTVDPNTDERLEEKVFDHVVLSPGKMFMTVVDTTTLNEPELFVIDENGEPIASVSAVGKETSLTQPEQEEPPEEDPQNEEPQKEDEPAADSDEGRPKNSLAFLRELGDADVVILAVILGVIVVSAVAVTLMVVIRRRRTKKTANNVRSGSNHHN